MVCGRCGSDKVSVAVQQVSAVTRTKNTGCLWSIGRGLLIICTLGLWLLIGKRKSKGNTVFINKKQAVCQTCGASWDID